MPDAGQITYWIIWSSTAFFALILAAVVLGPSQYDLHRTDQIPYTVAEEAEIDRATSGKNDNQDQLRASLRKKYNSSVTIVVLGDIGRSPRMQYHANSFIEQGAFVQIVGYKDTELLASLQDNVNVKVIGLRPPPKALSTSSRPLFPILAPLKILWQTAGLSWALYWRARPTRWMLVQNPPSIPTLAICRITSVLRNVSMVIDWHNFESTILAVKMGRGHPMVGISNMHEMLMARAADHHICVSKAMAGWINHNLGGVTALPFYDRPTDDFTPMSEGDRKSFLKAHDGTSKLVEGLEDRKSRLLVSSTSWTADEDFGLLLDALVSYSAAAKSNTSLPRLRVIITGKGPLKAFYLDRIAELESSDRLLGVAITTTWLSLSDYASILGLADLGVCLHKSTSGVDLPMKVVDMFGAGLPVVGWSDYKSWPELVKEGINGRGFKSADQLLDLLVELFQHQDRLQTLKQGALEESKRKWREEWLAGPGEQLFYPELKVKRRKAAEPSLASDAQRISPPKLDELVKGGPKKFARLKPQK